MVHFFTKTRKIETGNEIINNDKDWKIFTDVNQYGKEVKVNQKQLDKMVEVGLIEKVNIGRNLAYNQKFTYKYIVK